MLAIFENPVTGSVEFGYVSMHDSLSGEWYELEVKDASSWALNEARKPKELYAAC